MARDPLLTEILTELRTIRADVADLRDELAEYRGAMKFVKWSLGLVATSLIGGGVYVLRKVGVLA